MSDSPESYSSLPEAARISDTGDTPKRLSRYREFMGKRARDVLTRMHVLRRPVEPPRTLSTDETGTPQRALSLDEPRVPSYYEPQADDLPDVETTEEELRAMVTEDPRGLADILTRMRISRTGSSGAFFSLYVPILDGEPTNALAIKVIETEASIPFNSGTSALRERTDDEELQVILDADNVVFVGKDHPRVEELNETERSFLLLALEHARHEEFYGQYVLPADFIEYPAAHDVLGRQYDPGDPKGLFFIESFSPSGRITTDNRLVHLKKGEPVYAMVQRYENMGPSVFDKSHPPFTEGQKTQLRAFVDNVQDIYERYGYFPDDTMSNDVSANLRFNNEGRLLLIDTNGLKHTSSGRSPNEFLQRLREIAKLVNSKKIDISI